VRAAFEAAKTMPMSRAEAKRSKPDTRRALHWLAIFCLLFPSLMSALDPHSRISQYGHTAWRAQDGFPGQVNSITQTTDGYIWILADDGLSLSRFDGVRFIRWTPPNHQSLPSMSFTSILAARDGSLWIGTTEGLARWKDGQLTNYAPNIAGINSILEDHTGKIWVTRYRITDGGGSLCWVKGSALQCYGKKEGNPTDYGFGVAEDSTGDIWFAGIGVSRLHQGSFSTYLSEQTKMQTGSGVPQITASPSGEMLADLDGTGPNAGVQKFSDGKWSSYIVPGFDGRNVGGSTLFVDKWKTLWVGTESNGIYRVHDGVTDHYGSADGLSSDSVNSFYEDMEGNLWVGTDAGMDLFRDRAVVDFSKPQGLVGSSLRGIFTVNRDAVWVADDAGLSVIQSGASLSIRRQTVPGHSVEYAYADSKGQVWMGLDDRVFVYKDGHYTEAKKADGSALGRIAHPSGYAEDTKGNLWVLSRSSNEPNYADLLLIRDQRVKQVVRLEDPLTEFIVADRQAGIWTLSERGLLTHYIDGIARETRQLDRKYHPLTLGVDSQNVVWVATNRGLIHWSNGQLVLLDSKNGLPCSSIFSTIQDDQGSHWLRTTCGIVRIPSDEWERWLKSPESKVSFTNFDALDGFHPDSRGGIPLAVAKSGDGRLWFATTTSVQMVDPNRQSNLPPPPVHIEEVAADHKTFDSFDRLALPPLRGQLEIDYTALSFSIPQRVRFRYKLEGHDEDWQDPGTRRQAFYNDLPPRKYRFRVIACNNDGVWNQTGATLDFSILPAYYQTAWFRALCGAAILSLLWFLYQFRLRQLQHQFDIGLEARVNERTRIARELHDTLLQSFQGAAFQFQAARRLLLRNADNAMQFVDEAIHAAEDGITEGRAAIHDLRPATAAQRNLPELLRAACEELTAAQELNGNVPSYEVLIEGKQRDLAPMLQDEVYRICREVIRNAFAHAAASHIEVEVRYDQNELRLRIRDDGKGIDPSILEAGGIAGHFGIPGMRERAQRIGSRLDFWSEAGAGTEVQLTVPASKAYKKQHRFR
jgi:signal transduction histidine kinase/ligand-binding sensor domain-containing protein